MIKKVTFIGITAVCLIAAGCVPPPPTDGISCGNFEGIGAYTPGASDAGVDIDITPDPSGPWTLSNCVDDIGAGITSGVFSATTSFTLTDYVCTGEIPGAGTGEIVWSDATTSTFTATATGNVNTTDAVVDLTITDGPFDGAQGSLTFTGTPAAGQNCVIVPVTSATFVGGPLTLAP